MLGCTAFAVFNLSTAYQYPCVCHYTAIVFIFWQEARISIATGILPTCNTPQSSLHVGSKTHVYLATYFLYDISDTDGGLLKWNVFIVWTTITQSVRDILKRIMTQFPQNLMLQWPLLLCYYCVNVYVSICNPISFFSWLDMACESLMYGVLNATE